MTNFTITPIVHLLHQALSTPVLQHLLNTVASNVSTLQSNRELFGLFETKLNIKTLLPT